MKLPDMNRALTLEGLSTVADGAGGYTKSWVVLGTLWAEVLPGSGRDVAGEDVTLASIPYRITVRAAPIGAPSRPVTEQRLREGTRVFRILAVTERDGDARYLTCFAREEELDLPGFGGERLAHFPGLPLESDGALEAER